MSKNTTRKGLAVSAGLALVGSALVGVPANAAISSLTLSPVLGSGYDTVLGATFNLKLLAAGNAGEVVDFYVEGATEAQLTVKSGSGATSFTSVPTISSSVTDVVVDNAAKTANFPLTAVAGNYVPFSISLDDSAVTATTTVKITPFIDSVLADNTPGAGELAGTPITLTFHKASEVSATVSKVTLAPLAANSGSIYNVALVTLDKNVNMADTVGGVGKVQFKKNAGTAVDVSGTNVAYSTADSAYKASVASNTANMSALAAGDVVSVQAFVEGETTGGAVSLNTVAAGEITSLTALAVSKNGFYDNAYGSTNNAVRVGSGKIVISTTVDGVSTGKSVAGQKVTFTVKETNANDLNGTLSAGGKTLSNAKTASAEDITVDVLSDASGKATLTVDYAGIKDGDEFTISAEALGASGVVTPATTSSVAFVGAPSTAEEIVATDLVPGDASPVYSMVKGAAGSLKLELVDNWGQVPAGDYRVNWSISQNVTLSGTTTFSNGVATISWTDNSQGAVSRTLTLDLEKLSSGTYSDDTGAGNSTDEPSFTIDVIAAAQTPNRVTATSTPSSGTKALNGGVLYEVDLRKTDATNSTTIGSDTVSGVVYSTTGGTVSGAKVTVSAPGVLFSDVNKKFFKLNSITVTTNASGAYSVYYAGNKAGDVTFTVTAGTATATATEEFAGAAETDGAAITFTGTPDSIGAGRTLVVKIQVADAEGNPVAAGSTSATKLNISWAGPGYVGTIPTKAGADGTAQFSVLLGANDSGSGVVTVGYDQNGDGDLLDADDLTVTKTITVGAAAASTTQGTSVKRTGNTVVVRVTGYAKSRIVLNGARVASRSTLGTLSRTLTLRAGRNVIQIVVDGTVIRTVRYTR